VKVVIIGAGVAGLGIGWRLLQAGAQVTILERGQAANGATRAAAGMLAVTAELEHAAEPETSFANYSNALWEDFKLEIEQVSGRSIGFSASGALMLAADTGLAGLRARAERQPDLRLLDKAAIRALAPMLTGEYSGALWAPHEAHVDSRALGEALTIAFLKVGGVLFTHEAVVQIGHRDGKPVAHTPFAVDTADAILVAAGAWTGLVADVPIMPIKGEMIALTPPAGTALPGPVIWGNGIYAVPRDGRLLIGATVEDVGFDTSLTSEAAQSLRARAEALMPDLRDWTLADHWAGLRPRSPDGLPLLGPTALPGVFVASGQYRNGILFAPAIARMMADLIMGHGEVIPAFDPRRFG
jgi:glycine oxidase